MTMILWAHIAGGFLALLSGVVAAAARKGSPLHAQAGRWFVGSMLVLGVGAAILEPFRLPEPGSPAGPVLVCYFVVTSWVTARRRDGVTGKFEMVACAFAFAMAALIEWNAFTGATTPAGREPVFAFAGLSVLAGLGDLKAVLRKRLTPAQRLSRHLWRMCFAFFVATGSFFLGQQDLMPVALRGSPALFVLAFAPFALMAFWLVRIRFAKPLRRITQAFPPTVVPQQG